MTERYKCPCTDPACTERYHQTPRFAYENPADLAWGAALLRVGRNRRLRRLAAERAALTPPEGARDDRTS